MCKYTPHQPNPGAAKGESTVSKVSQPRAATGDEATTAETTTGVALSKRKHTESAPVNALGDMHSCLTVGGGKRGTRRRRRRKRRELVGSRLLSAIARTNIIFCKLALDLGGVHTSAT